MQKKIIPVLCGVLLVMPTMLIAKVAPFGLEIGEVNFAQAKSIIIKKTSIIPLGLNRWTEGKSFQTNGLGLEIEGLKKVTYIFDQKDILAAVILEISSQRYQEIISSLRYKYPLISQTESYELGDKGTTLVSDDVTIEVISPVNDAIMTLSYLHENFKKLYKETLKKQKEEQSKKEISQL